MKFKEFMMLQLFADDPGSGATPGTGGGTDPGVGGDNPNDDDADDGGDDDDDNPDDDEKKYSIKEVDELIKRKKAEWEKQKRKDDDEAKKFAKMNAQEKAEYKQQQLEKRIQELEDEKTLAGMRDEARKQLSEKGINISDNLLEFMVSKDAEKTKKAVDSFAELFNAAVNEAVKGKARQTTPREGNSFSGGKSSLDIGKMARDVRIIK
ncbi:hypothetical protein EUBC25_04540 [Claveliimonas bilis]|uniref:DUF4355 domain-containing protein n=1 Tax=Claveliimonas bilis TaxID=3028070 RepID=UPI001E2FAB5D|nr:DUF4355 domain-containing protein [Claveliimonas bilis]BCZ26367.1 hypothetical protein EUBC25_04540 [Claveliimonas bilis]